ncbi:MAG: beta strand repeat-containing protein [Planctomyces sp.]
MAPPGPRASFQPPTVLWGSTASDFVGRGIRALTNGNYVVASIDWDSGTITNVGAVTWGNGTIATSGVVSASNSLVGSTAGDKVGNGFVTALTNGNYVVVSADWDSGTITNVGAVTWGNGTTGISGVVSASNSLVGSTASDFVGLGSVTALTNGNYVVASANWDSGTATNAGAVTWGNGTTGISGVVSSSNSVVGQTASQGINWAVTTNSAVDAFVVSNKNDGSGRVVLGSSARGFNLPSTPAGSLQAGNGSVSLSVATASLLGTISSNTDVSITTSQTARQIDLGTKTSGTLGLTDTELDQISATTLRIGNASSGDLTISSAISTLTSTALQLTSSQSIQVRAPLTTTGDPIVFTAKNGITIMHPVITNGGNQTLDADSDADGIGALSLDFPLQQFTDPNPNAGNAFGSSVLVLPSGNVVVTSPYDDAGGTDAGAVYLFNGITGALISTLRGSSANDQIGSTGLTQLTNGNYVIASGEWDSGTISNVGAVTWGNGTTGISGVVSSTNSLVGSTANDYVGGVFSGVTALTNGNYVVRSSNWDSGAVANVGAVTWGNGTTGISGVVSSSNSLVGSTANDYVGSRGVSALTNGNYVVASNNWDSGTITNVGAVTWGNGTTGIAGVVSATNSLVGSTGSDYVSDTGVTALTNGNYVVGSSSWMSGTADNAGAVTWGNGTTGISGVVSSNNSLTGSTAGDGVGSGVIALTNGNYIVGSHYWDFGAVINVGAVTWANGTTGISGVVSASNSLIGSKADDKVGGAGLKALTNGNYVVASFEWDSGTITDVGAVTWGNGTTGTSGVVSSSNSLVGSTANDFVGSYGITALTNGNYVVASGDWDSGTITDAGAVTWGNGTTGTSGVVSSSNSLVGSTAYDDVGGYSIRVLTNGNYVVASGDWDSGTITDVGAVTWGNGTSGISGVVSASNSLVGSTAYDNVGSYGVTALTNGNYVFVSGRWDSGTITDVGAVTWGNGTAGTSGVVSSSNSIVGQTANRGWAWAVTTNSAVDAFLATNSEDGSGRVVLGSSAGGFTLPSTPAGSLQAGSLQAGNGSVSLSVATASLLGTISSNADVSLTTTQTARQIDLGTKTSGKLGLTDTELDQISAATLRIGNASSGDLTISSAVSRPTSTALQLTSSGAILLGTGAQSANGAINTAGGTLSLDAGTHINPATSGVDADTSAISFATGDTLRIEITGATADSQYSQLSTAGPVTLTGLSLSLSVTFPGMTGTETFTIVSATGGITGQFSGLTQGGAISIGGFPYTANYNANSVELVPAAAGTAPAITQNPSSQTVVAGNTATLTATASGSPSPTVQWQVSTNSGTSWSNISGATSTTYSFTAAAGDNGKQYRAVFTNTAGSATSTAATLTVQYAPTVTTQPTSQTVLAGATVTFTAAASGNPTPTVKWQSNSGSGWSDIAGATSVTYSFTATAGDNGVQYRAVFTNGIGSDATTNPATLSVPSLGTFTVSKGQAQRSYVRYLDVGTDSSATASALSLPGRVRLLKADLNGNGATVVPLTGFVSASGSTLAIDFGAAGLGGSRNTNLGDGYYTLGLDLDGDGAFESSRRFYRLLGDVNGDRQVNPTDVSLVTAGTTSAYNPVLDINGDGVVNGADIMLVSKARGRKLADGLLLD